ncbi:MAG TPA: hypothetical protein VFA71_15185 [Terriglobales bacterium]|nr:hypothetical protein [Terriglobales bacterium]
MPQRTKVLRKPLSRVSVRENDGEVDVARLSQIVAACFHPTKHICICIIGMDHQVRPSKGLLNRQVRIEM